MLAVAVPDGPTARRPDRLPACLPAWLTVASERVTEWATNRGNEGRGTDRPTDRPNTDGERERCSCSGKKRSFKPNLRRPPH